MAAETGKLERVEVEEARRLIAGGEAQALDVRGADAWNDAHIPGAQAADEGSIEAITGKLEEGQRVILVTDGDPPEAVTAALSDGGFEVSLLEGGMDAWKEADFTIQPTDDVGEDETEHGTGREETPA
jgi:rhodanese-related sulfurtransferase